MHCKFNKSVFQYMRNLILISSSRPLSSETKILFYTKKIQIGPFGYVLLLIPASTFALGTWQVQRKKWKEDLIKDLKQRSSADPQNLPTTLEEIQKLEYYPVHVRGEFLHDKEIYMGPRTLLKDSDATTTSSLMSSKQDLSRGYLVITPFKLEDRNETVLVNRGWVSARLKHPRTRTGGQVTGVTDVIGIVRLHENRPVFMPANTGETFLYRNLEEMCALTGASPIYLDATTDFQAADGPIGGQTRISLRNEHLSYIFTWYSLSAITAFMWCTKFFKRI